MDGENGNVKCCLQKKSVEVLREVGAVNESDYVDINTGALIFSTDMMKSLYFLIETQVDYFEVSYGHGEAKVGEHCILSYIDIHDEVITDNVVMYGLKQRDGKFIVRIFEEMIT